MHTSTRGFTFPLSFERLRCLAVMALGATLPAIGHATEGGVGRPITGMQVIPYSGIVPPTSDWIVSLSTIYYEGSLGATKTVPIAGTLTGGLTYHVSYTIANLVKTWGVTLNGWNFASSFGLPFQYTDVSSFNHRLPNDSATQFADIFFTPIIAGYPLSKDDHIAFSVQIYAPTGAYNSSRLANAGQNTWTFTPTVTFTHLWEHGVEVTANWGVEFYTENNDTHYKNAPLSVLDVTATKQFDSGWGVGGVVGWIQQFGNDTGGLAQFVDGAEGYSVGAGPIVTWSGKLGKTPVSASLRVIEEFAARNRPKGTGGLLSIGATFD